MSRKPRYGKEISLHLAAALAVAGLALAACQPTVSEEEKETGKAIQGGSSKGGHLIMAWDASHEPASLDGHVEPYQPAWLIDSFIADPLLILGPDGKFHPALAKSWTSSANADEWTFHLRNDVTFQDGTPFNAQALEYNLRRILNPETRSAEMAARLGPVEKIEIVDDYTLTLHYGEPWVILLDGFWRMPIWSPTAAEKWGPEEFDKHLVGAGPFTLEEWLPNSHVTLKKWEGYGGWNSISEEGGTAHLESVTINFIGEEAVLGSVVQTGNAHIAMNLPAAYIDDYRDKEGFRLIKGYQAGTGLLMVMNTRKAPFDILEFRQALLYGTDQVAINDLLYDGSYLPSYGPLNTVHPCHWDGNEERYPHDPEMAKSLLEKTGYRDQDGDGIREAHGVPGIADGTPLLLRWTVLHYEEIGEAIQAQWRELGIDLVIEMVPGPVQLEKVNARDFDFIYERQRSPDPMLLDMLWNSANDVVGGWAWTGFVNKELDETVSQLRVVPEHDARCELAYSAQSIIMDNALMIPTLSEPVFYAVSDEVVGFQLMSEGNYHFLHNTYIRD
jgi:peptide/nickel transport system substrate-binding protein